MKEETIVNGVADNFQSSPSSVQSESQINASNFSKIKKSFTESSIVWQILKLVLYASFGIGAYVLFFSPRIMSMNKYQIQESIINSEQVVINKDIRGIFPPLIEDLGHLVMKWKIKSGQKITIGDQEMDDEYILEFKWNRFINLMRSKCNGDFKLSWKTFFNNILIKIPKTKKIEPESMIIPNLLEDEACILENKDFISKILNASIWTAYGGNLYLLLEDLQDPSKPNEMLIFEQARN